MAMRSLWVAALLAGLVGCRGTPDPSQPVTDSLVTMDDEGAEPAPALSGELLIFAAASLGTVLGELESAFRTAHPGISPVTNAAGTQFLVTQIESGAPADVLLSANESYPAALAEKGLLDSPTPLCSNRLAMGATRKNNTVNEFQDALEPGVRLVLCAPDVPAGQYTDEALARWASAVGEDQAAKLRGNVVSQEADVTAAATKIAIGEADAGFIYRTDVITHGLRDIGLPGEMRVEAVYTMAAATNAPNPAAAKAFVEWLSGPEAQGILAAAGFDPPPAR